MAQNRSELDFMISEQKPSTGVSRIKLEIPIAVALFSASFICTCVLGSSTPHAPRALTISPCREVPPNMHRISARLLIFPDAVEFDVPETIFVLKSMTQDSPPGEVHFVRVRDRNEGLEISNFGLSFEKDLAGFAAHSAHAYQTTIRTSHGRKIGEDHWGYLKTGERWRYLKFTRAEEDGYRPMPPKYADLLDNVLSSACLAPAPVAY
jgi:hypothetical protein